MQHLSGCHQIKSLVAVVRVGGISLFKPDVAQALLFGGVCSQAQAWFRQVNADDLGMLKSLSNRKTAFAKSATHVQHIVKVSVAFQPLGKTLVGFKTAGIGVDGGSARLVHQAIKVRPNQIARVLMDVDCMVVVRDRHCWVEL